MCLHGLMFVGRPNMPMLSLIFIVFVLFTSCSGSEADTSKSFKDTQSASILNKQIDTISERSGKTIALQKSDIDTRNISGKDLVAFAKTLVGTPYKYASSNPETGFDCSGFITHIFRHFNISVPRSSIDFTDVGTVVKEKDARPGDLILFTGTNPKEKFVGHMGLVTENAQELKFIHATSGKAYAVTITPLNKYYRSRFVKIIRIFPNDGE